MATHRPDRPVLARGRAVVGIDVGKHKHAAAAVGPHGETLAGLAAFANTAAGVDRLEAEVFASAGPPRKILFALEATGHYWMPLYHELVRRGYEGVVLNPLQTNGEARTRIRKTKTDRKDAEGIARFILTGKARAARIPDEATEELRILTRRLTRLLQMKGDVERAAQTLSDRLFPEYDGCFSKPFLASGRALIRELGLIPELLAADPDAVRQTLARASRGRLAADVVENLIDRAGESIGVGRTELALNEELCSSLDLIEHLEGQIAQLDQQIAGVMGERPSPPTPAWSPQPSSPAR